jgi:paraquat-inducible protein B
MSLYAEIQEEIRQNIQNILTNKCPLSGRKLFYPISAVREQAEIDVREALREEKRIKVNYVGTESNQNGAKITIRYVIIGDFIVFELEKRLDELSAKVDDEAKKLSDLTLEFANVEGKLTTVETDITTLKADVASAKSDILINHDDIAEIDGKIADRKSVV